MAWHTSISALTEFGGFWPGQDVRFGVDPDALWGLIASGNQSKLDEAFLIPDICATPTGIWRDLKRPGQEKTYCISGVPDGRFRRSLGLASPVLFDEKVFVAFLTDDRIATKWRWEESDSSDRTKPTSFNTRFGEVIWSP